MLSPSGRVAQGAERGLRLPELSLNVFALGGENISFGLNREKVAHMRRKRGARRLKISDKISDNQNTNLLILFNPLLFQVVVDPSLSPFIPTITIVCGGRHLSRMQPFSLIPNLHRARTFCRSPSGRVAQGAERGLRLPELSLKVFPLCGKAFPFGESGAPRRERSPLA